MPDFSQARKELSSLPISPYLDEICSSLKKSESRFLVLTAETAAGKSTAVPIALLENFSGKILMLEPRRLAASAIAERISSLLGEDVGETVGYRLHLDSKVSKQTRLEVITEAILTRRLQNDPLIEDVNVVVLDEFHERSIHSDLALAFLKETMQLREDLFVIVMSATIDYQSLAEYLGTPENPAPVMKIPGRQFPVTTEWKLNLSVAQAIFEDLSFRPKPCPERSQMNRVMEKSNASSLDFTRCDNRTDTILAFLPGIYEIRKTKSELENYLTKVNFDVEILILHSSVPISEQRKILRPCPSASPRRVILSSAIAETSLTVPGVTIVVDSGLCRMNKMNVALGMERLVTEKESLFSAEQRAGRAGRIMAGKCVRLWDKNEPRLQKTPPEILRADLTQLVLECAEWGADEIEKVSWLDPPPKSAWETAKNLLGLLGCLEKKIDSTRTSSTKITEKGKVVLRLGLHPRLACVALAGGAKAVLPFSEYADASPERQQIFLNDLKRRLQAIQTDFISKNSQRLSKVETTKNTTNPAFEASREIYPSVLAGYPDRLARRCDSVANADFAEYQFPSGRKARLQREILKKSNYVDFPDWLVAPEVDAGERIGKIYSFKALNKQTTDSFLSSHSKTYIKTEFANSEIKDFKKGNLSIQKKEVTAYGELILKEKNLPSSPKDFAEAICTLISEKGLFSLPFDSHEKERIENFLLRVEFFAKNIKLTNERKLDISTSAESSPLLDKLQTLNQKTTEWLSPFITNQKIDAEIIYNALYWYLNGSEIDRAVPNQITLPNGRKRNLHYEKSAGGTIQPVLEIIIQQIFGCFETPEILGVPVLLKLLSPASRPLQITNDLAHFWETTWPEICKEMKGRYPKHNWDYRIF